MDTLTKWWTNGNKEMRDEIKKYFFGLSFYNEKQKDIFWEKMMKRIKL